MRYKTKPFEVDAVQWTGNNFAEVSEFAGGFVVYDNSSLVVWDYLQGASIPVNLNDYIIRGSKNEYYPCAEDVFKVKYEPI